MVRFIALFCLLLFVPFYNICFWRFLSKHIDLYYRKFEFNAGLYYLLLFVGQWATASYNLIQWLGPSGIVGTFYDFCTLSINVNKWLEKGYALAEVGFCGFCWPIFFL